MMKFPYAISDFYAVRTEGYLYLDRTIAIPALEAAGKQLLFLRPRRFGKSLLLSTLAHYYDYNLAADFELLFGDLFINFAHEVLIHDAKDSRRYYDLLESEGIVKTLFKVIKGSASEGKLAPVFITGVSPLVLSDMTSGYNVARDISLEPAFNALCGINQAELDQLVQHVLNDCPQAPDSAAALRQTLRQFYNGYRFCEQADAEALPVQPDFVLLLFAPLSGTLHRATPIPRRQFGNGCQPHSLHGELTEWTFAR